MKTQTLLITAAAASLLLASCGKGSSDSVATPDPKYITVEAEIGNLTRATTTGVSTVFDKGDQISLYAWTESATAMPASLVVNGVTNTLGDDGKWTPETLMLWQDMTTLHYFLSIYPKRTVADFTADEFSITEGNYQASDLLAAVILSPGLTATNNPVNLTFNHQMAKLYVNMNFRTQWDAVPTIASCTATAAKTCTINYLANTVTPKGEQVDVPLAAKEKAENFSVSYEGIMVPQTGFRTVSVKIGEQTFTYTHDADIPLVAGKFTTLNLIVGRNKIEIGTVDITDWTDGGNPISGEAM